MTTLLLTGGAGYIGSHVSVCALKAGFDVIIYDDFSNATRSVINKIEELGEKEVETFEGDVLDELKLTALFCDHKIDAVIHLAGKKSVEESSNDPLKYYRNNVEGSVLVGEAAAKAGVKGLVFSSSATVYGATDQSPLCENAPLNPANPYGQSKLMAEWALSAIANAYTPFRVTHLRYFNPVGAHPSGMIGENGLMPAANLLPLICEAASGKRDALKIFGRDYPTRDGTGIRDYLHVMDLAEAHIAAINELLSNDRHQTSRVFNLGTGKGQSVLEIIKAFESILGSDLPVIDAPRREGDVPEYYANSEKAQEILKWNVQRDLSAMCEDHWRFYSQLKKG